MGGKYIAIVGAGPIGGILGAFLASAGEKVVFVDILEDHLEAIRTKGLAVSGVKEMRVVVPDVLDDVAKLAGYDLDYLFIATKTTVTDKILPALREVLNMIGGMVIPRWFGGEQTARIGIPETHTISAEAHQEARQKATFTASLLSEDEQRIDLTLYAEGTS